MLRRSYLTRTKHKRYGSGSSTIQRFLLCLAVLGPTPLRAPSLFLPFSLPNPITNHNRNHTPPPPSFRRWSHAACVLLCLCGKALRAHCRHRCCRMVHSLLFSQQTFSATSGTPRWQKDRKREEGLGIDVQILQSFYSKVYFRYG